MRNVRDFDDKNKLQNTEKNISTEFKNITSRNSMSKYEKIYQKTFSDSVKFHSQNSQSYGHCFINENFNHFETKYTNKAINLKRVGGKNIQTVDKVLKLNNIISKSSRIPNLANTNKFTCINNKNNVCDDMQQKNNFLQGKNPLLEDSNSFTEHLLINSINPSILHDEEKQPNFNVPLIPNYSLKPLDYSKRFLETYLDSKSAHKLPIYTSLINSCDMSDEINLKDIKKDID